MADSFTVLIVVGYLLIVTFSYQAAAVKELEVKLLAESNFSIPLDVPALRDTIDRALDRSILPIHSIRMRNERNRRLLQGCKPSDIEIHQAEISGVGMPRFSVQVTNTCYNKYCVIQNIIIYCRDYYNYYFNDPNKCRRLNRTEGTCIINNGNAIKSQDYIEFMYGTIYIEHFSLKSAQVICT